MSEVMSDLEQQIHAEGKPVGEQGRLGLILRFQGVGGFSRRVLSGGFKMIGPLVLAAKDFPLAGFSRSPHERAHQTRIHQLGIPEPSAAKVRSATKAVFACHRCRGLKVLTTPEAV